MFAGLGNEVQSLASPGTLEKSHGKQMLGTVDAPIALFWDLAFIPPAFEIVLSRGRHQSKYVSSFSAGGLSANISGYKVFLLWRAKGVPLFVSEMDKCFIDRAINNPNAVEELRVKCPKKLITRAQSAIRDLIRLPAGQKV